MKKILAGFVVFAMVFAGTVVYPSQSVSAKTQSSVSMYDACRTQWEAAYHWEVFVLPGADYNIGGWRCYLNHIKNGAVTLNVARECIREYGSRAVAKYRDYYDPYSWYCEY